MFKIINLSLGEIQVGLQQNIYYPYDNINKIIRMDVPCDCSIPLNEEANSRLLVRYVPKPIPVHLKQKNIYQYTKKIIITVLYTTKDQPNNQQTILLSFTATVKP